MFLKCLSTYVNLCFYSAVKPFAACSSLTSRVMPLPSSHRHSVISVVTRASIMIVRIRISSWQLWVLSRPSWSLMTMELSCILIHYLLSIITLVSISWMLSVFIPVIQIPWLCYYGHVMPLLLFCVLYSMSTQGINRNFSVPYYGSNGYRRFLVYDADIKRVFTMNPVESKPTVRAYDAVTGEFIASYSNSAFYMPQGMAQSVSTNSDLYISSYYPATVVRITYDGQQVGQPYRVPGYNNLMVSNFALDDLGNLYTLGYGYSVNSIMVQLSNSGSIVAEYDCIPKYGIAMKWMTVSGDGSILYAIDDGHVALVEWKIQQESHPSLLNNSLALVHH